MQRPLWALADRIAATTTSTTTALPRQWRWALPAMWPLSLAVLVAIAAQLPPTLPDAARGTVTVFGIALVLWSTTRIDPGYVALSAVMALVVAGDLPQSTVFASLAADVVWLMIGAFVLGAAVQHSGLAARLTGVVARRTRSVGGAFWWITAALVPLALVIPSTSGRAAVALPIYRGVAAAIDAPQVARALALLVPSVILVATIATLVGAGSHLVANDLMAEIAGRRIGFGEWMLYGLPFAVAAAALTCAVVLWLFVPREERTRALAMPVPARAPWSRAERTTLAVGAVMFALWSSEGWHGLEIATVAVAGALLLALPGAGVLGWKDALGAVSWRLVLFVGAALALGDALVGTGAAAWMTSVLFDASGIRDAASPLLVLLLLSLLTLTAHVYMTSHTARAVALVPALLLLAAELQLDPAAVVFIGTVGMNYCLTFPVSSKALLVYQDLGGGTGLRATDLLRLSAVMLPLHVVLIVAFHYGYWQWVGLRLL